MPRTSRIKGFDAIYHIMSRSISEVNLFKEDDDKKKYLEIIKDYKKLYQFKVYAYCLLSNHVHMIIDVNGADISKIMHSINFKYALYFNRKYNRHGHLFQDRFKSKIVTDDKYLINLSAYIHNNPRDVHGYENGPEKYYFSSLAVYLGLRKDPFGIVDEKFILGLFGNDNKLSRQRYSRLVVLSIEFTPDKEVEFIDDKTEYKSYRKIMVREFEREDIIQFVANKTGVEKKKIHLKYIRKYVHAKALIVVLLKCYCNSSCSELCDIFGNITQAAVSRLCRIGLELVESDDKYKKILEEFVIGWC